MVKDTLEKTKKLVWPEIEKYLKDPAYPIQFQIPKPFEPDVEACWKINREYPERKGKYLRPTAVLLIAKAMRGDIDLAIKTAAAMQLSEEWILISDDIEDGSKERRGKPTLHKMYGTELAINASDTLETVMWKMIFDLDSKPLANEFYKIIMRTALGQGIEQIWTNRKIKSISNDEYFLITDSKSAYYSIAGPMRLGAIIANATSDQMGRITNFGLYLGRCFQLVDDLIDLEQDKKEGKTTLANTKGVEYTKKLASEMKQKAKNIFDKNLDFLKHQPARNKLEELMNFILERKY